MSSLELTLLYLLAAVLGVVACRNGLADVRPREALVDAAVTPPSDGFFDVRAGYLGAFRDASDTWDSGWTRVVDDHE